MYKKNLTSIISMGLALIVVGIIIMYLTIYSKLYKDNSKGNNEGLSGNIVFVSNRTDKRDELNKLISEFEEINPNVKVKLELIGDAEEILGRKASVGELPDVTLVPSNISRREYGKYFLKLDDLGFSSDNTYNYYLGVGSDDELYALSTSLSWFGVIYNKDIFNSCGISKLPNTNEEFFNDCKKIKESGVVPIVLNYKQSWVMNAWLDSIPTLLNSEFKKNIIDNKYEILDKNSELYKSFDFAKNIYENGYCEKDILNYDWTQCKNDIVDGKTAMIIWNSDFIYQLMDMGMKESKIGMFPIPNTSKVSIGGDYKIGISKTTKHVKESKAFLKFLMDDDRYAKAVNIMSTLKDSNRSVNFFENLKHYNIPVQYQDYAIISENEEEKKKYEEYEELKGKLGIDYTFVQQYIVSKNTDSLREKINKESHNYKK